MQETGWVGLPILPTFTGFRAKFEEGVRAGTSGTATSAGRRFGSDFGHKASQAAHERFRETARYIVGPLVGVFATEKIFEFVKEALGGAADLEKSQRRLKLVFGDSTDTIDHFGEHAANNYGLSDLAAQKAAASFGLVAKAAGLNEREGAKFAVRYTKLGADLADFGGTDPEQAFTALQRGLAGATRGLKPYGVLIDSTSVKAEALADGILKPVEDSAAIHSAQVRVISDQVAYSKAVSDHGRASLEAQKAEAALGTAQDSLNKATAGAVPPLTQQQKILAASKLIWKDTATQQGSFKDSQGGVIEQQRKLNAQLSNAKDRIGKGLLPIYSDLVHAVNKDVVPAAERFSRWFEHKGGPAIHDFVQNDLDPLAKTALPAVKGALHDVYDIAHKLEPVVEGIFKGFTHLPKAAQEMVLISAGAAYLGRGKLAGAGGSLLSKGAKAAAGYFGLGGKTTMGTGPAVLGEAASLTKPIPVFVTNEGFGGKGGNLLNWGGDAAAAETSTEILAGAGIELSASAVAALAIPAAAIVYAGFIQRNIHPYGTHAGNDPNVARGGVAAAQHYGTYKPPTSTPTIPGGAYAARGGQAAQQFYADQKRAQASLKATGTELDAVRSGLGKASASLDLVGQSARRNFGQASSDGAKYQKLLGKLPTKVVTAITTPGMVQTQTDVDHLARLYNLTPRQVSTIFTVIGIDQARAQINGLLGMYHTGTAHTGGHVVEPGLGTGGRGGSGGGGSSSGTHRSRRPGKVRLSGTLQGPDGPTRADFSASADRAWEDATS